MMITKKKKVWALLLSAALLVTQLPTAAVAENNAPEDRVRAGEVDREGAQEHKVNGGETDREGALGHKVNGGVSTASPSNGDESVPESHSGGTDTAEPLERPQADETLVKIVTD